MAHDIQTVTGGSGHGGISWLFCALVFIAPFVIPRMYFDFSVVSKEAVIQIGTMALMALWLFGLIRTGCRVRLPAVLPYIVIFLAYVSFTLFWAVNPFEGFSTALHWSICALAVVIVANAVNKDHLFLTIFASGVLVAVIGLLQNYAGFDYFQQTAPPGSTFANRNFAAHYVAACLPLGFILRGKRRALTALGVALILAYAWACKTDAAMVAIVAMAVCACVCVRRLNLAILIWFTSVVLTVFLMPGGHVERERLGLWQSTSRMITENPFGVGLGNFEVIYPAYSQSVTVERAAEYAHSEYAQILAEAGYVGAALLALAFIGTFMSVDIKKNVYGVTAIVGICVVSAFSFPMRLPNVPFVGACILGVVSR